MPKILIVDDEQINLDFFEVMLSKLGFEVAKATDGEEALELVREHHPDLVVLDNIMPKLSGWEVTKILKQDEEYQEFRDIPIIMFSAMDDVKDKIEGFELGIEDYITKPFNFSEVLARIKAALRNRELAQQVLQRERRLELAEKSLAKSLAYFDNRLREPVDEILKRAEAVDNKNPDEVEGFVNLVVEEVGAAKAALEALETEIDELRKQDEALRENEVAVGDLDEKYQQHFRDLRENADALGGSQE